MLRVLVREIFGMASSFYDGRAASLQSAPMVTRLDRTVIGGTLGVQSLCARSAARQPSPITHALPARSRCRHVVSVMRLSAAVMANARRLMRRYVSTEADDDHPQGVRAAYAGAQRRPPSPLSARAMSRSRRKSPHCGFTTAESEKRDKAASHRVYRHALRHAISRDPDTPPPTERQLTNPYSMGKDGKMRFDPKRDPKLMRK